MAYKDEFYNPNQSIRIDVLNQHDISPRNKKGLKITKWHNDDSNSGNVRNKFHKVTQSFDNTGQFGCAGLRTADYRNRNDKKLAVNSNHTILNTAYQGKTTVAVVQLGP